MKQSSKLVEFRQAIYDHGLTLTKDAQFELVDALLLNPGIRSFPELSLFASLPAQMVKCLCSHPGWQAGPDVARNALRSSIVQVMEKSKARMPQPKRIGVVVSPSLTASRQASRWPGFLKPRMLHW